MIQPSLPDVLQLMWSLSCRQQDTSRRRVDPFEGVVARVPGGRTARAGQAGRAYPLVRMVGPGFEADPQSCSWRCDRFDDETDQNADPCSEDKSERQVRSDEKREQQPQTATDT